MRALSSQLLINLRHCAESHQRRKCPNIQKNQRCLNEAGYHCYCSTHKIILTFVYEEQCITFILKNLMTSREEWESMIGKMKRFLYRLSIVNLAFKDSTIVFKLMLCLKRSGRILCAIWDWISGTDNRWAGRNSHTHELCKILEDILVLEDIFLPSLRVIYSTENMLVSTT